MIINKLKEIRMKEYLMNQKEFSEMLEVSNKSYSVWEKGSSKPAVDLALKIAKKLNRKVEDIWSLED